MHERTQIMPSILLIFLELICIVFYGVFTEYHADANILLNNRSDRIYKLYGCFQDIHVMMFIGFGFLMTFLKKYWFSALGMNFWLAALTLQWYILTSGFWHAVLDKDWGHLIQVQIDSLINGDFAAASILICFGALIGKVSFNQMTIIALLQLVFYSLNEALALTWFKITDIGGSMLIHTFGAYFGLTVSLFITNKKTLGKCADIQGSNYTSDLFSMVGTIFLWMYWPSFNGAMAESDGRERVVFNTVISLTNSCLFAFIFSRMVNPDEKFDMIHIQNATLAGGVAIGAVANLPIFAYSAMIIGAFAGVVSVLGFKFLLPWVERIFGLHDTCGVHNLHGMPGMIGGIVSAIAAAKADSETYGTQLGDIFPMISSGSRTAVEQGCYQILCLFVSMGIAIGGGMFTACVIKLITAEQKEYFQDILSWEGAEGYIPIKKRTEGQDEEKVMQKAEENGAFSRHHKPSLLFLPSMLGELKNMSPTKLRSDPLLNRLPGDKKEQALKALQEMVNLGSKILSPTIGTQISDRDDNKRLFTIDGPPEENIGEGQKQMSHIIREN